MAGGKWSSQTKAGYTYDVLLQEEEADCGLCCVAMVVNLMGQGKPTSDIIQKNVPSGAYKKSTRDRAGMKATPLATLGLANETHSDGTVIDSLRTALTAYNIPSTSHKGGDVQGAVLTATPQRPVIVRIGWRPSNSGHWVVVPRVSGGTLFILDPYFGFNINIGTAGYVAQWRQGGTSGSAPEENVSGDFTPFWLQLD